MTHDEFAKLFTREALRPFQPEVGSEGLTPILEVTTRETCAVFLLAIDNFNDAHTRFACLRDIGRQCAQRYPDIDAVRFGSEAWMRPFTEEEAAARGERLVESYPDKTEAIIVFGQQPGAAVWIAQARVYRRSTGGIERLGPWQVSHGAQTHSPLLGAFWEGYHATMARRN
jgi:hypothetical protein